MHFADGAGHALLRFFKRDGSSDRLRVLAFAIDPDIVGVGTPPDALTATGDSLHGADPRFLLTAILMPTGRVVDAHGNEHDNERLWLEHCRSL